MTPEEAMAGAEAAFAVELASSAALRALLLIVPREHVRQLWMLGYGQGMCAGLQRASDLMDERRA